jgi:hypothetical protein
MIKHAHIPEKEKINCWTSTGARTANGQMLEIDHIYDPPDDNVKKQIIETLKLIRKVRIPCTHKMMEHGGYGAYTRYDIEQLQYAGGHGGFIEALHIKNPPDNRVSFIFNKSGGCQDCFVEFDSKENLLKAWDIFWNGNQDFTKFKGFIRLIPYEWPTPWFYAIGDEELTGDFVYPSVFGEHPIYKPSRKFIVQDPCTRVTAIKTCWGAVSWISKSNDSWGEKERENIEIYWDDGTKTTDPSYVKPLKEEHLWIEEAVDKFRQFLSGKVTSFEVPFVDGTKFVGRFSSSKKNIAGRYAIKIRYKKDSEEKVREGDVHFKPTEECPTIESRIRHDLTERGGELVEIITCTKVKDYKASWEGVYNK